MTIALNTSSTFTSQIVNGILSIKPLAKFAKQQARKMIIERAEAIGVSWRKDVQELSSRGGGEHFSPDWEKELANVHNLDVTYPDYYLKPFHAYDDGNLNWQAATEVEVAAYSVHARIFSSSGTDGDTLLRQSYHDIVKATIPTPKDILDIGCSVGMSTFALQKIYPEAKLTGLDLSPYFLAIAKYRSQQQQNSINWIHAAAESTGLVSGSFDLVSSFLMFHELPQSATKQILREIKRLLRPGGYVAFMDMNPQSEIYAKMPPYVFTLLKSTEPWLDEYFTLNIEQELLEAGFSDIKITANSPRHRTAIAKVN